MQSKTALVIDVSYGIGRAIALKLASQGMQVFVHYGSGQADAEAVVDEIEFCGDWGYVVGADLSSSDRPHELTDQALGRLSIAVVY